MERKDEKLFCTKKSLGKMFNQIFNAVRRYKVNEEIASF